MLDLAKELVEKKEVSESTASAYIRMLIQLNDKKEFKNLTFLKKKEDIERKLETYAESSQKTILSAITSVLTLYKDKPTYKKVYQYYYDRMMDKGKKLNERDTSQKTEKQEENWIEWKDVQAIRDDLSNKVKEFGKKISNDDFTTLLHYMILSLYTEIEPRRNLDYLDMVVVKKWKDTMPSDKNYVELNPTRFIFNKYKTAKTYGRQVLDIPEALQKSIKLYLSYHPLKKSAVFPFLVYGDGRPLTVVNSITRILNKIFHKNVGSSMLRHIFITDKFGDVKNEMEDVANKMGHSVVEQQGTYNQSKNT